MRYLEGIPNILYKYRDYSEKYNKRTLFNFEIFLASTSMFNDPYEGAIPFVYEPDDLTEENIFLKLRDIAIKRHPKWTEAQIQEYCYEAHRKDLLNDDAHIEEQNEINRKNIDKNFGILSLAKSPTNYLMWSHYGNKHTGYCIGFDKYILDNLVQGSLGSINYDSKIPKFRLFEDIHKFGIKQLGTKYNVWEYEDEYRIVKGYAAKKTIEYPHEMIKKIYLGCNMKQTDKNEIIDFVRSNKVDCEIIELSLDKEIFKLNELRIY